MADHKTANAKVQFKKVVCQTAAFGMVRGSVIYVGYSTAVSDKDWDAYLKFLAPLLSKTRPIPRIVWDESEGPSPLGRQKLAELTKGCPVKVAIISDNEMGRNIATVLNWNREEQSYCRFHSRELHLALAFVGLTGRAAETVTAALYELRNAKK